MIKLSPMILENETYVRVEAQFCKILYRHYILSTNCKKISSAKFPFPSLHFILSSETAYASFLTSHQRT